MGPGMLEAGISEQEVKSSPLFKSLTETSTANFAGVFEKFCGKGDASHQPQRNFTIARKALQEVINRVGVDRGGALADLEKCLEGLAQHYGVQMVSLEVLIYFFERARVGGDFFSDAGLELVRYGRELLRQKKGSSFKSEVGTPLSTIVANECARNDPFCKSLIQWAGSLLPHVEPMPCENSSSSEKMNSGLHSEKSTYQQFRNHKDEILKALVFWRGFFTRPLPRREKFELLQWMVCIHLEGLCSMNTQSALRCLTALGHVVDLFPPALLGIFEECLRLSCSSHFSSVLEGLFPATTPSKDNVADDPIRDLTILQLNESQKRNKQYNGVIDQLTGMGMGGRQEFFSSHSSESQPCSPLKRRYVHGLEKMNPWHRGLVKSLFFCMLQNLACPGLFQGPVPLTELFAKSEGAPIWCTFIYWWSECCAFEAPPAASSHRESKRRKASSSSSNRSSSSNSSSSNNSSSSSNRSSSSTNGADAADSSPSAFATAVVESFSLFWESLQSKAVTIGDFYACGQLDLLHDAFTALGFEGSREVSAALAAEIEDANHKFQNLRKICDTFIKEDPAGATVTSILSGWDKWRIIDLHYFLPQQKPKRRAVAAVKSEKNPAGDPSSLPPPVPATLVSSLPWVLHLLDSKLLAYVLEEDLKLEPPVLFKLESACRQWEELFNQIAKQTIQFSRLEKLIDILLLSGGKEVELLYCSSRSQNFRRGSNPASLSWAIRSPKPKTIADIMEKLKKFAHLQAVVNHLGEVGDCFSLVRKYQWVEDVGSLEVYQKHVSNLASTLESHPWGKQTLAHYKRFSMDCEPIHPSLLILHPALFEKIYDSPDLLDWLRTLSNDQDFTRGIELAMGRSEMECPPELWLTEEGDAVAASKGSGRVNEQILSMLQSVRSYLHAYIYRESLVFPTADSFIHDFLAHLMRFEKSILLKLDTCNLLLEPLKVLLGGDSEQAAPNRLLLMLQPASDAKWLCDNKMVKRTLLGSSSEIISCLRLEYISQGKPRSLTVPEIEDFQSSVVLSRTDNRGEQTQQKIVNFVQSFGWMKIYASHLLDLNSLGHFSYDSFTDVLALTTDVEIIRQKALDAQKTLSNWTKIVNSVRERYPSLNHFGMKHIWKLVEHLREVASGKFVPPPENSQSLLQQAVHLVNPALVTDGSVIQELEDRLVAEWVSLTNVKNGEDVVEMETGDDDDDDEDESMTSSLRGVIGGEEITKGSCSSSSAYKEKKMSLEELLDCCGKTVQSAFGSELPFARHEVELPEGKHTLKLKPGEVRLVLARSYEFVFHEVLSSFVQTHSLPERRTLHLCRENTDWEEVSLLLLRWRFSTQKDTLFCLANADLLSNEVQIKAVEFIQSYLDICAPLLVICGPVQSTYIVSQFMNRRMASYPLPRTFLQNLVRETYGDRFNAYVSDYAGAGKSFQIRQKAKQGQYVPVPATSIKQFLVLLHNTLTSPHSKDEDKEDFFDETPNNFYFHFEIYDTAGAELNSYLFELIFFGGFCDFSNEVLFFYPPTTTSIALELPTGPLTKYLIVPQLCPVKRVFPSPSLFATSKSEMIRGMGLQLFYGKRYDGTGMRKRSVGVRHANAFDRLQYVCFALDILERNGGRFPFVFDCDVEEPEGLLDSLRLSASGSLGSSQDTFIPGSDCFRMLLKVSELPEKSVSLWCLWNFINLVYWQLRDMHFPQSPLNMICMPDGTARKEEGQEAVDSRQAVNQKESNESKLLMKGEILAFIFRTAREFATRQSSEVDPNEIIGARVEGFTRDFNGVWTKLPYSHCGRPVFFTKGHRTKYLMHFRANSRCWVIDNDIVLEGAYFAFGEGEELESAVWRSSCQWKTVKGAIGKPVKRKSGYQGEAIELTGLPRDSENGIYIRQPPYDDINQKPHYIKLEGTRRHLFHTGRRWVICPVCTLDEGFLANAGGFNRWDVKPTDANEPNVRIVILRQGNLSGDAAVLGAHEEGNNYLLDEETEDLLNQREEDFQEYLRLEKLFATTKKWSESNHECLLFSNTNHIVSFMSMDPEKMEERMHPNLLSFLKQNRFTVGESLDQISQKHGLILGALTEVHREGEDAKNVGGGGYCLTGDNLLKMLAIFIRLRVGIPVILMGECGCGKTALLNYLCAWLGVTLLILDVHGGTTPEEIEGIFETAERKRDLNKKPIYVFLDEVNACNHMGLICEVITKRTLHGKPIRDDIYILAALNPYRRRPKKGKTFGLVYKHKKNSIAPVVTDDMADLVYRVTPIPVSLRDFVFDFGSLELEQERLYVGSMVHSMLVLPSLAGLEYTKAQAEEQKREINLNVITSLIVQAQVFIREKEGDPSSVSLRDVRRFISFANFFLGMEKFSEQWFVSSVVISLALVYYFRLSSEDHRTEFWEGIFDSGDTMCTIQGNCSFNTPENYRKLSEYVAQCLKKTENKFCQELELGEGIALNNALTENLFVAIMCILNKVPVFLVGKPGTSKTLTLQIIASNLQGKQSPNKFWRDYPAVYVISYQCSPMSDSASIQNQYNMAVRYQEHASNTITVLLLDEVGLAEHSPDMPLKCLHGMLVNPSIAIVGLSNWVLDPAKMNRAVLVQRPEPSHTDISQTGSSILGLPDSPAAAPGACSPIVDLLQKISRAYFSVYTHQKDRDFIGMRDYYSLVKSLHAELPKNMKKLLATTIPKEKVIFAICRNFSGRDDILRDVLYVMCVELFGGPKGKNKGGVKKMEEMTIGEVEQVFGFQMPLLPELIRSNLKSSTLSRESRHLMLLTNNCAALPLIFSCGLVNRTSTKVIIGSEFVEDNTELFLVQQMNEVKLAMAKGKTIVLMNADNMYEALYDVLNQRYLEKTDQKTGEKIRLLRLAIGSRSSLCQVAHGFRIIVIVEKEYAYRSLDLPLLNRFEKQILTPANALYRRSMKTVEQLSAWAEEILEETSLPSKQHVFCGFHPGTIPSLIFRLTQEHNCSIGEAKKSLKRIATPAAITLSPSLHSIKGTPSHNTLTSYVQEMFGRGSPGKPISSVVMTCSPVTHLEGDVLDSLKDIADVTRCRLDQVKSEKAFCEVVKSHLLEGGGGISGKRLLLVQFDPIMCSSLQINHAKFLVTNSLSSWKSQSDDETVAVLFLVHMPPGIKTRTRTFVLDFRVDWDYFFLDDIRGFVLLLSQKKIDLSSLLQAPLKELFNFGVVNLEEVVSSQIPAAISRMRIPIPPDPYLLPFLSDSAMECTTTTNPKERFFSSNRIHALKDLLEISSFHKFFHESIYSLLEWYGNAKDEQRGGLYLHTSLAIGDFSGGTLLQSLVRTVSELTLQATIALLILLEKNFTLGTLEDYPELWMELVQNKNAIDLASVHVGFALGGREVMKQLQSRLPANTGKNQILVSKFPFSYAIFALLSGGNTREAIEAAGGTLKVGIERFQHEAAFLDKTLASFFGDKVAQLIHTKMEKEGSLSYFDDFVTMIAPPVDKLMMEEVRFVYQAILQSFHPQALQSPATIHAAFMQNKNRIQVVCSVLSILSPSNRLRILSAMNEASNLPNHSHRLVCVLEAIFDSFFHIIWNQAAELAFVQQPLGTPCSQETTCHLSTLIATASENLADLLRDWEVSIQSLPPAVVKKGEGAPISPIQRWSSVMSLKILLEGYEKMQWGMGPRGQKLMELLGEPTNNPCSFKFFDAFFNGLALFYAPIRCCIECGGVLGHIFDQRNPTPELLCLSCTKAKELLAKSKMTTKGTANAVGEGFWEDFLLTPAEREARVPQVAPPKDGRKRKREGTGAGAGGSGTKKRKGQKDKTDLTAVNEKQNELLSRRFLERAFVRYVDEVLFSTGLSPEHIKQVDPELVAHINSYANCEQPLAKSSNKEVQRLIECRPSSSTCLALMHILLQAERRTNIEEGRENDSHCLFKITTPKGKMVYLSYWLSEYEEQVEKLDPESPSSLKEIVQFVSKEDLNLVVSWLNEKPGSWGFVRKQIRALARVQVALRWYGKCLASDGFPSEEHKSSGEYSAFHNYFNGLLIHQPPAQQYILKTIKEMNGIEGVLVFLVSPDKKGTKWVQCDDSQLSVIIEDCPIGPLVPSSDYATQYAFQEKIRRVLAEPNNNGAFQSVVGDTGLVKYLIPALYNEVAHRAVMEKKPANYIHEVVNFTKKVTPHLPHKNKKIAAGILPLAIQVLLLLAFGSVSEHTNSSLVPCVFDGDKIPTKGKVLCQISLRILDGVFQRPDSWMAELMTLPEAWSHRYFPGSKFENPFGNVRWYECSNGHPYSIGECGRPMQTSKCPQCGAAIGGRDHTNVAGVKDRKDGMNLDFISQLGYQILPLERVERLGSSASFFRILVDLSLFLSTFLSPLEKVARVIRIREPEKARAHFVKNLGKHVEDLHKSHRFDMLMCGVLMNATFCNFFAQDSVMWRKGNTFTRKESVHTMEKPIKEFIRLANNDIHASIQTRLDSSFQVSQRKQVLKKALGERQWDALLEGLSDPSEAELLFHYLPSPTMEDFFRSTDSTPDFKARYPLLSAFIAEENRLQLVQCMIPILKWHRLLFSVFPSNEIDHVEAGKITNEEAVMRLPTKAEREKGRELLIEYCDAFNKSFPLVGELLYQCDQNIFLKEGKVSLFGETMSPTTPIAFSLPSISEGQATRDPMGLCTVGLLTALHRAHEDCLHLGDQHQNNQEEGQEEGQQPPQGGAQPDHNTTSEYVGLPEISCSSFSFVLRQKLVVYDRQAHFLPLLNIYSSPDERGGLKYDFASIEDGLRLGVLHGKQSTRLHIQYYQFRGDVRSSNRLAALRNRVPQHDVSEQTMQLILHEVDIESRLIRLLSNLEMVINFVARIGGEEAKEIGVGRKLVREYALETLQIDLRDWEEGSTATMDEQIRLCHLSSLFMRLQEEAGGNPLDDIPAEFRAEIEEAHKEELQKHVEAESEEYCFLLLPKLRNFLVDKVASKEPRWERDPEMMLKDLLMYEFTLEVELDWFDDHFPDILRLRHAFALFQMLMKFKG